MAAFTGTVAEYGKALNMHNFDCEECAPKGLPRVTGDPAICKTGRAIRFGLAEARNR